MVRYNSSDVLTCFSPRRRVAEKYERNDGAPPLLLNIERRFDAKR